jgi:hypothetical protein
VRATRENQNPNVENRIKVSRKEAKESRYWLRLPDTGENDSVDKTRDALIQEAPELMNIFGAIVRKGE